MLSHHGVQGEVFHGKESRMMVIEDLKEGEQFQLVVGPVPKWWRRENKDI